MVRPGSCVVPGCARLVTGHPTQGLGQSAKNHGNAASGVLLDRLRKELNNAGTLNVLRHGIEFLGLKEKLSLAQFKPALVRNTQLLTNYRANRVSVVRQVRYSLFNENAIDLVLFLNGLPVVAVELKTGFTQPVAAPGGQCRFDRNLRSGEVQDKQRVLLN